MSKLLAIFILCIPFYSMEAMVRTGVEVEAGDDDGVIEEEVWIGPGWYYGVWFDDEDHYHRWHHDHHGHGGHHGGGHHGGGHGGGGHHRGGHGGGHH